ncbi:hypothetical protein SRHO_G00255450 [Serrasalmus rhombeus]
MQLHGRRVRYGEVCSYKSMRVRVEEREYEKESSAEQDENLKVHSRMLPSEQGCDRILPRGWGPVIPQRTKRISPGLNDTAATSTEGRKEDGSNNVQVIYEHLLICWDLLAAVELDSLERVSLSPHQPPAVSLAGLRPGGHPIHQTTSVPSRSASAANSNTCRSNIWCHLDDRFVSCRNALSRSFAVKAYGAASCKQSRRAI